MRKTGGFLAALSFVFLAVTACTPGVQPLLDEYNALFGEDVALAGGGGTQEKDGGWFSKESYDVSVYNNLDLHAPAHCSSYQWVLEPDPEFPNVELPPAFRIEDWLKNGGSYLNMNMSRAGFKAGTRYILTCTVVSQGKTLTDRCFVVVKK